MGWGQREVEEGWRRGGGVGGVISFGCVESKADVVLLLEPAIVQELCESRGGRPGLSVLTSLLVSVDVKNY